MARVISGLARAARALDHVAAPAVESLTQQASLASIVARQQTSVLASVGPSSSSLSALSSLFTQQTARAYATDSKEAEKKEGDASSSAQEGGEDKKAESGDEASPSAEELLASLTEKEAAAKKLQEQVEQLTDSLKRSLAEMENVRQRTAREMDSAKKFAVQGFVKSMLDVADNLERASSSVPTDALEKPEAMDVEKAQKLLKGLLEGVQATQKIMLSIFKKAGVEQYDPTNEKFNPNEHNALFEVPDPSKEPGTVAVVTKKGYKLHERIIRPAEVGVVRAP